MAVPIEIVSQLNALGRQYLRQFEASLRNEFNKNKFKASGATADSLKAELIEGTPNRAPELVYTMDEAAEFTSKRRLIFVKQPPIDEMLDTIRSGKFKIKNVPGYENRPTGLSLQKQRKRVAFAMARHKLKEQTHKRKNWRRAALRNLLNQMNEDLLNLWAKGTEKVIADLLSTKR